jgi:signal transduction histidine kinase
MWCGAAPVSVVRVLRRFDRVLKLTRSHPLVTDLLLAAALLALALVSFETTSGLVTGDPKHPVPDTVWNTVWLAGIILPLALRRRFPLSVLLVATTAFMVYTVVLGPWVEAFVTVIALSWALYSAAAHGRPQLRNALCAACLAAIIGLTVFYNPFASPLDLRLLQTLSNVALFCALWSLGAALGVGRRRAQELLQRTVELEREREENARRAVFDERVRIARELHDVVAHHVSMMGVQAGAARLVLGRDPVMTRRALASIETSSRQAVVELHRLLGFLRQAGDPDDLAPQPGLGQLHELAASVSAPELTVDVHVEGDERPIAPTIDVSAYRIVQEALTNTLKHARASRVDVHLRYWPHELEIEVVDDGRGNGNGAASSPAGGLGLIGMRERAALHGGQLAAGPAAGGGFAVRVRLPTPAGAL